MKNETPMTKEFLAERDSRIFKMRQAGVAVSEIAKRFSVSSKVVSLAVNRQLEKLNREDGLVYLDVLRMELERLDALQAALWPLTQFRKVTLDDGSEVQMEPDLKAVQQVLNVFDRRAKLLGMDQTKINIQTDTTSSAPIRATLAGQEGMPREMVQFDPESEARKLLSLMAISGVLPQETVDAMLGVNAIIDAEVIDDEETRTETKQLESGSGQGGRDLGDDDSDDQ
jgi:hypothetical protein